MCQAMPDGPREARQSTTQCADAHGGMQAAGHHAAAVARLCSLPDAGFAGRRQIDKNMGRDVKRGIRSTDTLCIFQLLAPHLRPWLHQATQVSDQFKRVTCYYACSIAQHEIDVPLLLSRHVATQNDGEVTCQRLTDGTWSSFGNNNVGCTHHFRHIVHEAIHLRRDTPVRACTLEVHIETLVTTGYDEQLNGQTRLRDGADGGWQTTGPITTPYEQDDGQSRLQLELAAQFFFSGYRQCEFWVDWHTKHMYTPRVQAAFEGQLPGLFRWHDIACCAWREPGRMHTDQVSNDREEGNSQIEVPQGFDGHMVEHRMN